MTVRKIAKPGKAVMYQAVRSSWRALPIMLLQKTTLGSPSLRKARAASTRIAWAITAAEIAAAFAPFGMRIKPAGERIGAASAIKIVRGVLARGLEALYVEAMLASGRLGIGDEVLRSFGDFLDERPAIDTAALLIRSHLLHAGRRADEMRLSAATLQASGIAPLMTPATLAVMGRSARSGIPDRLGG